jgi:hypothetical protein
LAAERAPGNSFGLAEAAIGFVCGFLLANLLAGGYLALAHRNSSNGTYGEDLCSLVGLWVGFVGAAVFASKMRRPPGRLRTDYGIAIRPLIDVPLGIAVGVASQLGLVPLLELPLLPFVHNLSQQIGKPAQQLTGNVFGVGFVVLAVFVCLGSPLVEEVFFRGLLLRSLLGRLGRLEGFRFSTPLAIVATSLLFALAHFEAIQFLGLAGFGVVLALLAWRTGRLGAGIVAHATFNTVAIIAIANSR